MSIGNALYSHITVKEGRVRQSNTVISSHASTSRRRPLYFVEHASAERRRRTGACRPPLRDLQCDLRGHRQADQGTAGRSAAVEGLESKLSCRKQGKVNVQNIDFPTFHSAASMGEMVWDGLPARVLPSTAHWKPQNTPDTILQRLTWPEMMARPDSSA
jgi:hypothetical protein